VSAPAQTAAAERAGFDREPPHDLAAEAYTLGCMLLSQDAIADVAGEGLEGRDFYRGAHQHIFAAVMDLHGRGEPVTPVTVANLLAMQHLTTATGGPLYLHDLVGPPLVFEGVAWHARIVRDKALVRRMIEAGTRIEQIGYEGDDTAEDLVARGADEWAKVLGLLPSGNLRPIGPDIGAAIEDYRPQGILTGFRDLDLLTGGLQPGQMIVVAGRPGSGKSTFALDAARHAAIRDGLRTGLFSLEMSRTEVITRIVAAQARVPYLALRDYGKPHPSYNIPEEMWERITQHMGEIADAPLLVDDEPEMPLSRIHAAAMKQLHAGTPLQFIVIDYLQLIIPAQRHRTQNRQEDVSAMARGIKLLAKLLRIPILVCAQLNRGPEQRADHKPLLADLRESGSVEQDSDLVILIHREDMYEPETPRAGEADLIVAKHRAGPCATITVAFQGHYSRFADMARI
jgi:replicative DNA helicase